MVLLALTEGALPRGRALAHKAQLARILAAAGCAGTRNEEPPATTTPSPRAHHSAHQPYAMHSPPSHPAHGLPCTRLDGRAAPETRLVHSVEELRTALAAAATRSDEAAKPATNGGVVEAAAAETAAANGDGLVAAAAAAGGGGGAALWFLKDPAVQRGQGIVLFRQDDARAVGD